MALRAVTDLNIDPTSTPKPVNKSFDFTADLVDRTAPEPKKRTVELALSPDNELVFDGGKKSISKDVSVGNKPVTVTFSQKPISGDPGDRSSFRVTLREQDGEDLVFAMILIE
jgi:hypothetical protein